MTSDDAREELARLIDGSRDSWTGNINPSLSADAIFAAGYEKRTPAGEAVETVTEILRGCINDPVEVAAEIVAALSTRPAGEGAGVVEALEMEMRRLADAAQTWADCVPGSRTRIRSQAASAYDHAANLVRDRLATHASRAPAADASGVEG